jgi:hypothetical protein
MALTVAVARGDASALSPVQVAPPVPEEEYPVYDAVIQSTFLTSATRLVLIERLTVTRTAEAERPYLSRDYLQEHEVFGGRLPPDLLDDFLWKLKTPSRLEARFGFGVPYRFFSDGQPEGPEVWLAPIPVVRRPRQVEAPLATVGLLRFSRVGFTPREDQALVYVEEDRADGTGGGVLVWLGRYGRAWSVIETEVLWVARTDEPDLEWP